MEAQKLEQQKSYQTIQLIIPSLKGYSAVHSWVLCPVYIKTWEHGNNEGAILVCRNVSPFLSALIQLQDEAKQ